MLDKNQLEIVNSTEPRIIVEAGAGSGKTYTLIERIRKILKDGVEPSNIVCITFTKMAADELKQRLIDIENSGDCFVGTIHAFANKILKNSNEDFKILNMDIQNQFMTVLITSYAKYITMDKYFKYIKLEQDISLGKKDVHELDILLTPAELNEVRILLGRIRNNQPECYKKTLKDLCKQYNVLDFDELLKRTTDYFKSINGKVEYLFVDEYQDIGPLEKNFFQALNADNYFYVGDEKQCQPKGTLITMSNGELKKIESLKVGDEVLSYNLKKGYYSSLTKKGRGKKILEISEHFENKLVEIELENGLRSSYTKNHRCLARIHYKGNENKSVVYLMKNTKGQYRVGSTKLFTFNDRNFDLRARMNTEKAVNGWILDVYDSSSEAWVSEQICAYQFGIPQTTWTYKKVKYTNEDIDKLYEKLGDLTSKAQKCLEFFGRDINYPIFTKNINKHFSKIHVTEINACNLIPKIMDMAVPYKKRN